MDFNVCSPLRVSKNRYFDVFAPEASRAKKIHKKCDCSGLYCILLRSAEQKNCCSTHKNIA